MRKAAVSFVVLFYLFCSSLLRPIYAAELSIDSPPLTIDQSQEFELNINFLCSGCGDSYLRGVFYPSGNSYFGYTQNNVGSWVNAPGGDCTNYFKIAKEDLTSEGSWSGKLKFKPDSNSSYYSGPGEYLFKIGRYTPSCSSPSTWSAESTVSITGPTPTPTPAPTSAPTSTSTPTPNPTSAPTPAKTLTPTLSPTLRSTSSSAVLGENSGSNSAASSGDMGDSGSKELFAGEVKNKGGNWSQKIFIFIGIVFIAVCAILTFRIIKKGEQTQDE